MFYCCEQERKVWPLALNDQEQHSGTMADIQAVLAALDIFTRAPDKDSLEKANSWLQDFQHSVITLSSVAHRLRPLTRHHPPVLIV
jgi:hypothetical protein